MNPSTEIVKPDIKALLEAHDGVALEAALNTLLPDELVTIINDSEENDRIHIFNLLAPKLAADTFEFLDLAEQEELLKALPNFRRQVF